MKKQTSQICNDQKPNNESGSARVIIISVIFTIIITMIFSALSIRFGGFSSADAAPQTLSQRMSWPVIIHLATILPCLPLGGYILWAKKGDALHKLLGKIWSILMLTTATATIFIGAPGSGIAGSGFSFIHIFTILTFTSIPYAIWSVRRGDVEGHFRTMQGLYIGTFIAGAFAFLPGRIMNILAFG